MPRLATIKVKSGPFGRTLPEALRVAKLGDTLRLDPGHYTVDAFSVRNLRIEGNGDPAAIVLETRVEVTGSAVLAGLTLRAPHYSNAVHAPNSGTQTVLERCVVESDPAGKYPGIYAQQNALTLTNSTVHGVDGARTLVLEQGAVLVARESTLGRVGCAASRAELSGCSATAIVAQQRARVRADRLEVTPGQGQRSLVLEAESVVEIGTLEAPVPEWEAWCEESSLHLGGVALPEGETFRVITKGSSMVRSDSPAVEVRDHTAPSPREVHWPLSAARAFRREILPQARAGDTIVMDAGEYFLDEFENSLDFRLHLRGQGEGRTVLHGCLTLMESSEGSVRSLTLRARATSNALQARPDSTLLVENVTLEASTGAEVPAIYLGQGVSATIRDCRVVAPTDREAGRVDLSGAALEAVRTQLGWVLAANGSSARLEECEALSIQAVRGATVTGTLTLVANQAGRRQVVADSGSLVHLDRVSTGVEDLEMISRAAELRIDQLLTPPGASTRVMREGDGRAEVIGRGVDIESDAPDLAPAGPARTGTATPGADSGATGELDEMAGPGERDGIAKAPAVRPGETRFVDGIEASAGVPASAGSALPEEPASGTDPSGPATARVDSSSGDPMAQIMSLTGLQTVKEQIESFTRMVKFNRIREQRGLRTTDISMHSLFLGNPGTGKTTVARLLGAILHEAGAIPTDTFVEVGRGDLVSDRIGASARKTTDVMESARGGVLFIDEAYSLYQEKNNEFAQEAVDTLISFMENYRDSIVVIFAGYADRMQDFLRMNPGLQSRVPNRFDFEDYSAEEIAEIGYRDLLARDYTADEERYRRAVSALYGRGRDRSNGRWVRNTNERLVQEMVRRVMSGPFTGEEDLTRISDEDLLALTGGDGADKETVEELLAQLDAMVGLAPVKSWVRSLVNRVALDRQRQELDGATARPTHHMVFTGNPGTGKTTVAGIVARLFHSLGVLESPQVKVVERSSLVGRFIGQTEARTTVALDEAMGGVLFVDEAYQLTVDGSENDFGRQVVETLMTRLENERDRFVVIFAGYTGPMEEFLEANPGLRSRIPHTIEFPDFTPGDVARIVVAAVSARWEVDEVLLAETAAEAYRRLPDRDRSNGRWARNAVERLEALHSDRVAERGLTGDAVRHIDDDVVRSLL